MTSIDSDERTNVINQVKDLPFLDKVFRVIHYNNFNRILAGNPYPQPIELAELLSKSEIKAEELKDVLSRASHLIASVGGICSSYHPKEYTEIKQKILDDNPGFSNETYDIAISFDAYISR